jgi:integration host factor subunit beta
VTAALNEALMLKSGLAKRIFNQNRHLYQRDVENLINAVINEISAALARGDRVEIRGFGVFSTRRWKARIGQDPRTGTPVAVANKVHPLFKASKEMRARLNRSQAS